MNLMSIVPMPYRLLAMALFAVVLVCFGWVKGASHVQGRWDAANTKQELQVSVVKQRQSEATVKVVTQYVDRIKVVHDRGETITKEVPIYVTKEADNHCVLPVGFVRLHDAAARGVLPDPAGSADATPSGIALSSATGTVTENYGTCHKITEQLLGLQAWVRVQEKVHE